jgi:hypothetical protein
MSNRIEEPVFEIEELIIWLSNAPMRTPVCAHRMDSREAHETGESGISFSYDGPGGDRAR